MAQEEAPEWHLDGADLEVDVDSAWGFSEDLGRRKVVDGLAESLREDFDRVHTLQHRVPVGEGLILHVTESFTLCSWLRRSHRAVLFLSSSVHQGHGWHIPFPGYNAPEMVAQHGMFAYTLDYIGVGESSIPASGFEVTVEQNVAAIREVIKYIRFFRAIAKIDLVGEGYGGIVACQLAADARRIRTCTMIGIPYKELAGGPGTSAEFVDRLMQVPSGFLEMRADDYDLFLVGPSEVKEYIRCTQPGNYPVAFSLIVLRNPPFFDPSVARVPGLLLYGGKDYVVGPNDPKSLQAAYGTDGARLVISEDAGHAPRVESPATAKWLWTQIHEFIGL